MRLSPSVPSGHSSSAWRRRARGIAVCVDGLRLLAAARAAPPRALSSRAPSHCVATSTAVRPDLLERLGQGAVERAPLHQGTSA